MSYVVLEKNAKNLELVAYNLSTLAIKEGYYTNVEGNENEATTYIYKDRFFKNVIGTPTVVVVKYTRRNNGISIDVNFAKCQVNGENIIKESLLFITILPLLSKSIQYIQMKKRAKILAIKALNNTSEEITI